MQRSSFDGIKEKTDRQKPVGLIATDTRSAALPPRHPGLYRLVMIVSPHSPRFLVIGPP